MTLLASTKQRRTARSRHLPQTTERFTAIGAHPKGVLLGLLAPVKLY